MLIGPDGVIRRTYVGPQTEENLLEDIRRLMVTGTGGQAGG